MKQIARFLIASFLVILGTLSVCAQGTAFTYQGSLHNNGATANGIYDMTFTLFGSSSGGSAVASPITNTPTAVSNGLFTVTLDFGSAPFGGSLRWLEIAVRTNGSGTFTTVAPRQQLTPTPYAIFATTASNLSGTVSSSQVAGTYSNPVTFNNGANTFDGSFYGQFFGSTFIGGSFVGNFIGSGSGLGDVWHTGGNIGTTPANFLGTTDNQPLTIKVNGEHAQHFEPTGDAPNIVGGFGGNNAQPGLAGVTIAGGGSAVLFAGDPQPNVATNNAQFAVIAGGYNNVVSNYGGAILSGSVHLSGGSFAVIGGGQFHTNLSAYSIIGGGYQNLLESATANSVIAGGNYNKIYSNSPTAAIGGGYNNVIRTNSGWSSIGAGYGNVIDSYSFVSSIAGGFGNVIQGDSGRWSNSIVFGSAIAGGADNQILTNAAYSFVGGGFANIIQTNSQYSVIGAGVQNTIGTNGLYCAIAGGYNNQTLSNAWISTISGGYNNQAGYGSTVPGGRDNVASGNYSFAAGRSAHATNDGAFVLTDNQGAEFDSTANNQLSARFSGGIVLQTAGAGMTLDGQPVIAGSVPSGSLSGPYPNAVSFSNPGNSFSGNGSGLAGVNASTLNGVPSTGFWSTTGNAGTSPGANFIGTSDGANLLIKGGFVGIGRSYTVGSEFFGIQAPVAAGSYGGMYINTTNLARPFYGYSMNNGGVAAWHYLDGSDANKWKLNYNGDRLTVTSGGLVGIGTTAPDATLSVNGTADKPGGGSWTVFSDARLKKNVQPLEGALDRLMRLEGVTFEYKNPGAIHELPGTQIGMIAQEVEKVFPDWVDTAPNGMKRLSIHGFEALTVEALRDLRKEKDQHIAALEAENTRIHNELTEQKANAARLEARLSALERTLARFAGTEQASLTIPPRESESK